MDFLEFKKSVLKLYPECIDLIGPYNRKDGRVTFTLRRKNSLGNSNITRARLLLEIKLDRRLIGNETCDHIDNDCTNDDPDNLQVLSRAENAKKGWDYYKNKPILRTSTELSLAIRGIKNPNNSLSECDIISIRCLGRLYDEITHKKIWTQQELAEVFNCSRENIKQILNYETWAWIY